MTGISFRPFVFPVLAAATVAGAVALTTPNTTSQSNEIQYVPQAHTAIALHEAELQ